MERKGWVLVKLLIIITGVLIFIYLITPKLQKNFYKVRDLTTQANLEYMRVALLKYYRDNASYPVSLNVLVPKYLKKIPKEFLSSVKGSNVVTNARGESKFVSLRAPRAAGWIYGAYNGGGNDKFSHKIMPRSTTLSDKSGDTSLW